MTLASYLYPIDDRDALRSPADNEHAAAGLVCLLGIFLRVALSPPLLSTWGFDYESAGFFNKIQIGTYFVYLSFAILLLDRAQPIQTLARIFNEHKAFFLMFLISLMATVYWVMRGPQGVSLMIDTHLPIPIAALVLSYAPRDYCRKAIEFMLVFAALNGAVGMAEALGKFRVLPTSPEWSVLEEDSFRASALLGHPLSNAEFSSIALFAVLSLKKNVFAKTFYSGVFVVSLVAFGGRAAFVFSLLGLFLYSAVSFRHLVREMSVLKFFFLMAMVFVVPALLIGLLYVAFSSGMGDRLIAYRSMDDSSAEARTVAFDAFNYINLPDLIFGMSSDKVDEIVSRIGLKLPMADIENPWILMMLQLGLIFFVLWFIATAVFVFALMHRKPFIVKLLVLSYFLTASLSNSFGRKDVLYSYMVAVVLCLSHGFDRSSDRQRPAFWGSS
ncbi:MAG: VpsF family polysaccharide biosynthesis protein [Alphaproteobacteria bacterium]|nr:VpsF family polysaccharide biosynthesis protein [Alphaproteobacteria bacterium]